MTKHDFCREVARKADTSIAMATCVVDATIDTLRDLMADGDNISFIGFGRFTTMVRPERAGVNPATGEKLTIPERRIPKFKPAERLKELVK